MAPKRILVVEDDDLIRWVAAECLSDEGFTVVEAADGDVAAKHLDDNVRFQVLLTDVRMPSHLDGIELVAHARKIDPEIKVIVVSGYADQLIERLEEIDPPIVFIRKPYRPADIIAATRALLA